jgi:hypothetical protein
VKPVRGVVLIVVAALLLAACGGSKASSSPTSGTATGSSSTQTTPTVAASGHAATANVAVVNGTPITFATYAHWLTAAETSNASEDKQTYTIVPLWPPDFSSCITEVRQKVTSFDAKSQATVQKDCKSLFTALNPDTLNFLIESVWFEDYGAAHGAKVSQAKINTTFATEKKNSFKTQAAFETFLKENGETQADLVFRTKINLFYRALVDQIEGTKKQTTKTEEAAEAKVSKEAEAAYKARTDCAPGYATTLCTG